RTRPFAVILATVASLCCALAGADILNAAVDALKRSGAQTSAERFLVILVASTIGVAAATLLILALLPRGRSLPSFGHLPARMGLSLIVGVGLLGALELAAHGVAALLDTSRPLSVSWATLRVAVAVAAAGGIALWQARRRPKPST